jgi:hypothetical protein
MRRCNEKRNPFAGWPAASMFHPFAAKEKIRARDAKNSRESLVTLQSRSDIGWA